MGGSEGGPSPTRAEGRGQGRGFRHRHRRMRLGLPCDRMSGVTAGPAPLVPQWDREQWGLCIF